MKCLAILLVFIACYQNVSTHVSGRQNMNNSGCGSILLSLEGCCDVPKLFPNEMFQSCLESVNRKGMVIGRSRFRNRDRSDTYTAPVSSMFDALNRFRNIKGRRGAEKSMCLLQCVLREQGLLTEEEEIDVAKLGEKYMENATEAWKPVISEALAKCSDDMSSKSVSSMPTSFANGKICKPSGVMFMTCIHRQMAQKCPESSLNTQDETCIEKFNTLKSCEPFVLPGMEYMQTTTMRSDTEYTSSMDENNMETSTMESMDELSTSD